MVDGEMALPLMQLETLLALGLDQRMAENALVNSKVTTNLASVIAEETAYPILTLVAFMVCSRNSILLAHYFALHIVLPIVKICLNNNS